MASQSRFAGKRSKSRAAGTRKEQSRVLIVCGGVVTEIEYLTHVKSVLRGSGIVIKVEGSGRNPSLLAKKAAELKKADQRDARNAEDARNTYDHVWIVSDVDDFGADIDVAIKTCESAGVMAIVNDPCFELWLILHVSDHTRYGTTKQVQKRALELGLIQGKAVVVSTIRGKLGEATRRANALRAQHVQNGIPDGQSNPSTNMDVLIATLLNAATRASPGVTWDV